MAQLAINRFAALGVLSLVTAGAFFSACSDDANPEPDEQEAGTGAKSSTGNGGKGSTDKDGGTGAKSNTGGMKGGSGGSGTGNMSGMPEGGPDSGSGGGGGAGDSGTGGTAGTDGGGKPCEEEANATCGKCPPKATVQFLNACTDSKCTPFTATLEKIVNGKRPDLP